MPSINFTLAAALAATAALNVAAEKEMYRLIINDHIVEDPFYVNMTTLVNSTDVDFKFVAVDVPETITPLKQYMRVMPASNDESCLKLPKSHEFGAQYNSFKYSCPDYVVKGSMEVSLYTGDACEGDAKIVKYTRKATHVRESETDISDAKWAVLMKAQEDIINSEANAADKEKAEKELAALEEAKADQFVRMVETLETMECKLAEEAGEYVAKQVVAKKGRFDIGYQRDGLFKDECMDCNGVVEDFGADQLNSYGTWKPTSGVPSVAYFNLTGDAASKVNKANCEYATVINTEGEEKVGNVLASCMSVDGLTASVTTEEINGKNEDVYVLYSDDACSVKVETFKVAEISSVVMALPGMDGSCMNTYSPLGESFKVVCNPEGIKGAFSAPDHLGCKSPLSIELPILFAAVLLVMLLSGLMVIYQIVTTKKKVWAEAEEYFLMEGDKQ